MRSAERLADLLSQSDYSLSATTGTQAETRVCQPLDGESSTGTACRPLLPGLDRRSVLCPLGTGRHRIGRPAGYEVVGVFKETGSGVRLDRAERRKVMALAQARQIDAVLVTELSRWGRSTTDLLATLKELEARRVSVVALNGMTFDLATPHGRMLATMLAGIAEFERELIQERIRSGIAAEGARQAPGPPAWTAAEIRSPRAAGARPCRKGTQLSLDRARGGAEQEYRGRDRQTSSRHGSSDYPAFAG